MSILVNADEISQQFQSDKDWFIGRTILFNEDDHPTLNHLFDFNEQNEKQVQQNNRIESNRFLQQCPDPLREVERIHLLTQQLTEKPNRTCLSDAYLLQPANDSFSLAPILPSQDTIFELARDKPDNSRWTSTFHEHDEQNRSSDDDGFQSASSTISEEKNQLAFVSLDDHWIQAFEQKENRYFTWEQRGSYLYHRLRPFLFDCRLNDRPFQHLCLLDLLNQPSSQRHSYDIEYRPIAVEEFLRDLCYMLMDIPSQTFRWNDLNRTFELQSDVYVLGYTQIIIETFIQRYVRAGNQFHHLRQYVNQSSSSNQSETENIFVQALRYYLRFVQNSIAIEDMKKYSLIKFSSQLDPIIRSLTLPLSIVSTIEELEKTIRTSSPTTSSAFIKLSSILHTLLNHRYHTIDHNYFLLLIHFITYALKPLLTFLTNLIIYSNYLDRYNEYPIVFHYNRLIGLKTIDFWTKTFTIRYLHANDTDTIFHQILPIEYLQQIVNITRSLFLLKLCDKNHPLCSINTRVKPELKFTHLTSTDRIDLDEYQREMKENIQRYEQMQKQKRLDIEQAKVQERMEMYQRQDQKRAERKKLVDEQNERLIKSRQALRDEWQEQVEQKQRQLKEEKLAETLANEELNQRAPGATTIIGTRLATPYKNLVESVREEIIAEYDAKMRDANQREQQFRQRIEENPTLIETPKQDTLITAPSTISSSDSSNFHTPTVEQSPNIPLLPATHSEKISMDEDKSDLKPIVVFEKEMISVPNKPLIRHTATEETQQAEYRPVVKLVPSRVLQSTIQNYLRDHDPDEHSDDEEEIKEKIYDWDAIIANGPQFKYDDAFNLSINNNNKEQSKFDQISSWTDLDLSPLRVWLAHSIGPLIQIQSELVNRALLNYFFDELRLLDHLNNLRAFYFLATGRFGLAFCSELSRILLNEDDARAIYRINSMRQILYTSLDQTGDLTQLIDLIQLTAKRNLPNSLSLLDATLFDYFDLNYLIQWPLNIVISKEMFDKYQIIFRFLLRILIVKQVLSEIWVMLKGCKHQNSILSQLHQYRHQMQHFMTVLINYITNQVIQISWNEFMRKIQQAKHINEIAAAHHEYLDRTMLNCLLTPNAAPIFNEVNRVLTLIIRFRCQLKTFSWMLEATEIDPDDANAQALRTTFEKYHIAVLSLFKVLSKLVEKGYKTSLVDLLIRLNHNGYYDRLTSLSTLRRTK